jgi:SSS family solute:Na+ symporter
VFPAVVFGLYTRWFRASGLLTGWALGMALGTALSWTQGVKPTYAMPGVGNVYIGLIALIANITMAMLATWIAGQRGWAHGNDATLPADFVDA